MSDLSSISTSCNERNALFSMGRSKQAHDKAEDSKALLARLKEEGQPLEVPLLCDPSRAAVKAMGVLK